MQSYSILKKAIYEKGVKRVAADLKVSQSLVYKWCTRPANKEALTDHGALNPLDRVRLLFAATGDLELINWLCCAAGGYYVANPVSDKRAGETEVLRSTHKLVKEFGELLETISNSYENDKRIDHKESEKIRKEWEDLKRVAEGFVAACERGCYGEAPHS